MRKNIIFALIFILGVAAGIGGFYLFQNQNGLTSSEAAKIAIDFIDKSVKEQNPGLTASLLNVGEESGVYKLRLMIENNEYDSFISKDGKYLFSTAFNLEGQEAQGAQGAQGAEQQTIE